MSQPMYVQLPMAMQPMPQQGMSTGVKLAIAAGILVVLYLLFKDKVDAYLAGVSPTPSPSPSPAPPVVKPARPNTMVDCGYPDRPRGWYDVKGRGYRNDFCRHVGDYPGWWACAVQGEKNADGTDKVYSDRGVYQYDPNAPFDPYNRDLTGWHCP